jgi:hypothetical protein
MIQCKCCKGAAIERWLDFGPQALTNRFLRSPTETEYLHPLAVGACPVCGTVQIRNIAPAAEMRPRFPWITYSEPEAHLDEVARVISQLPELNFESTCCGLTRFDLSTLNRLRALGFRTSWLADSSADYGIRAESFGTESIQERLTPAMAERLASRNGRPALVVLRYVLEHAHDVHELLTCLRTLVAQGGYILLEVPDVTGTLERFDYSTIWEEHVFYLTPVTLRELLERAGFEIVYLNRFACALDHPLVAIVKPADEKKAAGASPATEELGRARRFFDEFPGVRARMRERLAALRERGKLAFLGAGHLSAAFINLFEVAEYFDIVVDDNSDKQGLYMPGSRLPIRPTAELVTHGIATCLMGVRLEVEDAIVSKNARFVTGGGKFASIFPASTRSLWNSRLERKAG